MCWEAFMRRRGEADVIRIVFCEKVVVAVEHHLFPLLFLMVVPDDRGQRKQRSAGQRAFQQVGPHFF